MALASPCAMPATLPVTYAAGTEGPWRITRIERVAGDPVPAAARLAVHDGAPTLAPGCAWHLSGVTSHLRYTHAAERGTLATRQPALDRPEATRAALIPIRKSEAWWDLAQDERRAVMAETSRHIAIGLDYLPAIARRLVHCREVGGPFDFLTWFEFTPAHEAAFDELLARLRATEEWRFVTQECEVRLAREA